jgi:hypothetical protein
MGNQQSQINFHRGQVLVRLANYYPSLALTLIEGAQNAIDADADRIMLCIDLKNRSVIMADNGSGTSIEHFEKALASVGLGIKDKDKLGRFGLGLISPLTKCSRFTFTSTPPARRTANRWTFALKDLSKQHETLVIPREQVPMPRLGRKFQQYATDEFAQEWRTMVTMQGVTQDKVTSLIDLDELEGQIQTKLGQAMHRNKTMIRVVLIDENNRVEVRDIAAVNYSGESLGVVTYDYDDTGRVELELYRAPKRAGTRSGKVSVMAMGDSYPITMREFAAQAWGRKASSLLSDAFKVLGSGYFEGVIRCEKIELAPERTKFVLNDALDTLYLLIAEWYDEYGKVQYEIETEQARDVRWQEIAMKSGDHLKALMALPEFSRMWDGVLASVEFGRLGVGHLDPEKGRPDGPDDETTLRTGQGGQGVPKTPGSGNGSGATGVHPPKDRPGDKPIGARGPSGQKRRLVKGDSKGLWFGFEQMPANMQLWEFDRRLGVLVINTVNPIWARLDETNGRHLAKNAKWIQHLLEYLAIEVLHMLRHFPDEDDFELNRSLVDDKIKPYVEMFIVPTSR